MANALVFVRVMYKLVLKTGAEVRGSQLVLKKNWGGLTGDSVCIFLGFWKTRLKRKNWSGIPVVELVLKEKTGAEVAKVPVFFFRLVTVHPTVRCKHPPLKSSRSDI